MDVSSAYPKVDKHKVIYTYTCNTERVKSKSKWMNKQASELISVNLGIHQRKTTHYAHENNMVNYSLHIRNNKGQGRQNDILKVKKEKNLLIKNYVSSKTIL